MTGLPKGRRRRAPRVQLAAAVMGFLRSTRSSIAGRIQPWEATRPPCVSAGGRCSKPGERLGGQRRGRTADLPISDAHIFAGHEGDSRPCNLRAVSSASCVAGKPRNIAVRSRVGQRSGGSRGHVSRSDARSRPCDRVPGLCSTRLMASMSASARRPRTACKCTWVSASRLTDGSMNDLPVLRSRQAT